MYLQQLSLSQSRSTVCWKSDGWFSTNEPKPHEEFILVHFYAIKAATASQLLKVIFTNHQMSNPCSSRDAGKAESMLSLPGAGKLRLLQISE